MIKPRRMRWAGHVVRMEKRELHVGFGGKARRKNTIRRPKRRWKIIL
jgi:hypothetical protein